MASIAPYKICIKTNIVPDPVHYENMPFQIYWKFQFYHQKKENFQIKNSDILHVSAQKNRLLVLEDISMFLSRNKENKVYPCKPQFYYIKVGFKGVKII